MPCGGWGLRVSINHCTLCSIQWPHDAPRRHTTGSLTGPDHSSPHPQHSRPPPHGFLSNLPPHPPPPRPTIPPLLPLIPKRGRGSKAKKNPHEAGIDLPRAKATQRLHLFPWRRDWQSKGTKQGETQTRHHLPGQCDRCWRARALTGRQRED